MSQFKINGNDCKISSAPVGEDASFTIGERLRNAYDERLEEILNNIFYGTTDNVVFVKRRKKKRPKKQQLKRLQGE